MSVLMEEAGVLLSSIGALLEALSFPRGLKPAALSLEELRTTLANVTRRFLEGPDAPLRVAFFGPTGVGKSKLFNSLLGKELSPSGFRRPFTLRPVYCAHPSHQALLSRLEGEVKLESDPRWRDVILIDTPDFDSVEKQNRREAERIFREADAFVFVTDLQKYADHATWEYLDRIFGEGRPMAVVLNKAGGKPWETPGLLPVAAADFFARLDRRFGERGKCLERILVPEYAVDDATLLGANDLGLEEIRKHVSRLVGSPGERRAALVAKFRADLSRLLELWQAASEALQGCLEGLSSLGDRLEGRFQSASKRLRAQLDVRVDPSLKAEVYSRIMERLRKIDILRFPRKVLALPLDGIKVLLGKWRPWRAGGKGASFDDPTRSETFQALESEVLRFAEESFADFRSDARCPDLLDRDAFLTLRLSHEELLTLYNEREKRFQEWLRGEAQETASRLTGEHKLKFILSQVIYNSAVVGIQIHTGGTFSLAELFTDSLLSPLVAKAVGMAVSSQSVADFEDQAGAEHDRMVGEILDEARRRFARHLASFGAWREAFQALDAEVRKLRKEKEGIARDFEKEKRALSPKTSGGASGSR